ncbi:MAG: site-specific DNA-methyltransferase [Lachnospiraceae bacterium]|jgi:adenine-specific DNA-methyltransferase|nr:site-specific DNA-methyltransferase [Lachnospiraceae bacterium]
MNKLRMETPDLTQSNIEKLATLFPACVTEARGENGKLKKAVDFELLRQMLSDVVLEGDEAYEFTWVGKKAAIVEANRPIRKTLRPCPEDSVAWDSTENLYIEGDNLEVLKLLQESYLGKVKMIYIDPPYNTGNDFIYRDDFAMSGEEYSEESGQVDENGDRLFKNTDSNGRFHSDWCSMIYSRLMLARNLLSDDGVIFISIDDSEQGCLKKICDEIFGASNFINTIIWEKRYSPQNAVQWFSENHDFVLVYAKNKPLWHPQLLERTNEMNARYTNRDNDPRGSWKASDSTAQGGHGTKNQFYVLTAPNGKKHYLPSGLCWRYTEEAMQRLISENRVWFGEDGNNIPAIKKFLSEVKPGVACQTIWKYQEVGHSQEGKKEIKALFPEGIPFDTPKPTGLLKRIIKVASEPDFIALDFFSGSATTAHAVMQLNAEDGGHRKFIMVQLPEPCDEKSEAYKAGYPNICEIGKERIRRAARKIAADNPGKPFDGGFRVFKLDDTNMTDVYYSAGEYDQGMLDQLVSNIKPDRTDLDLLFGCLLEWGLPLSMPYTSEKFEGCTIHTYNDGDLIACFDEDIPDNVIKEIAKRQPLRAVFRDSSFADSPAKINVGEIFKMLAPDTRVKVL